MMESLTPHGTAHHRHHHHILLCPHHHHHHHYHHHHHHHHHHPFCTIKPPCACGGVHNSYSHSYLFPPFSFHPTVCRVPKFDTSTSKPEQRNSEVAECKEGGDSEAQFLQEGVEEEEEDPIFVMTDEWMEFFAKSEAKRRLEKKQAKKKKKGKD